MVLLVAAVLVIAVMQHSGALSLTNSAIAVAVLAALRLLVYLHFHVGKDWFNNLIGSALAVTAWGYFLYQGVIDPMGGIYTLWPLFGISNQMLAGIALIGCTVILFKMKRERYAWVTLIPTTWLLVCTLTAGLQKLLSADPKIGFLSHAAKFQDAAAAVLAPAKSMDEMTRIVFNDYLDATLAAAFVVVVVTRSPSTD